MGACFSRRQSWGRRSSCIPHWWFSLDRTCVLHGFYCLHFVSKSPSSRPLTAGLSCIAWRACCLAVCSAVCPIPDRLAITSTHRMGLWFCRFLCLAQPAVVLILKPPRRQYVPWLKVSSYRLGEARNQTKLEFHSNSEVMILAFQGI